MKHNTILAALVITLFLFIISITCNAQMQVRVDSVSFPSRSQANIVGINNAGEKVYLHFGINKAFRLIRPGMWVTVWRVGKREKDSYVRSVIKLNN